MFPCRHISSAWHRIIINPSNRAPANLYPKLGNFLSILIFFFFSFCMTLHEWALDNNFLSANLSRAMLWFLAMEYCVMKWNLRLFESVTVYIDRLFLNSVLRCWDQWVGKGSQKFQGWNGVVACPQIMHAACVHCCFPTRLPEPPHPNVSDKARGHFLYDFLCNLNPAAVWDEHFPISLERGRKLISCLYTTQSCFCGENKFMAGNLNVQKREKLFKACLPVVRVFCFTSNSFYFNF